MFEYHIKKNLEFLTLEKSGKDNNLILRTWA